MFWILVFQQQAVFLKEEHGILSLLLVTNTCFFMEASTIWKKHWVRFKTSYGQNCWIEVFVWKWKRVLKCCKKTWILIDSEIPGNVHLSAMALVFSAGVSTSAHSYFDLFTIIRIKNIFHPGHNSNGNRNCVPEMYIKSFHWSLCLSTGYQALGQPWRLGSINQSINFNLNSHKHYYSVEKKKLNTFKYIQFTYRRW